VPGLKLQVGRRRPLAQCFYSADELQSCDHGRRYEVVGTVSGVLGGLAVRDKPHVDINFGVTGNQAPLIHEQDGIVAEKLVKISRKRSNDGLMD